MARSVEEPRALTLVVRLWQEENSAGQRLWCGRVENIATKEVAFVRDLAGVAHFIEHCAGNADPSAGSKASQG